MLEPLLTPGEERRQAPEREALRQSPAVETIFSSLRPAKAVVLAVSGGPDSVALMLMAADWAKSGDTPPVLVATVDHGLRPESRHEAEQVGLWAKALGLPHRVLSWDGEKPKTRVQERARDARYGLLCAYAAEIGADCLVTAHHADDQAETILFRLLRGSGLKGLAGMAFATPRGGLTHVRPLLDWTKDDLVALCGDRGHTFFDDPSNRNQAYARARLRRLSGVLAENGLDRDALLRLGARAARADVALQARAVALAAGLQNLAAEPGFEADISPLRAESEEILGRILEIVIRAVAGKDVLLRLDRLESASAALQAALDRRECFSATLGGTSLHLDLKTYLSIRPEGPRRRGRTKSL
ncbi:tRNA lysidine(34) synthetase TilS [Methyloferula stellata]|uniref:tRNA lysidine(34) synthetase TilS n=1 Tax=Methyloferula stellata TaxID=876270 RepID=UPI000373DD0E|nr:tRNA lysidine(34) synthetase TilS [Methyloferula stellata]